MAFDFADIASRYLDRRIDQATQPFTDPEAYFNRRLQDQYGVDLNGNVGPRTTTIKTNEDGTQTITNKIEMGPPAANAPQAAEPFPGAAQYALPQFGAAPQPMAAQPMAAQPMAAQPAVDPAEEERKRREAALQQQQAAVQAQPQAVQLQPPAPAPQVGPTPEPEAPAAPVAPQAMAQPQPQPAAPSAPVSPQQVAAPPAMPPMPQPGPGTQLAGPMVAGAVPQAQPPAAPAATQPLAPQWQTELLNAKDDVGVYHAVAGNKAYPAEIRSLAGELAANLHKGTIDATKAEKLVKDALNGDAKAANTLAADLRKKPSDEGSYIKAYLFSRLGLNDLAREEQEKLSTKKILGQVAANGQEYTTEVDKRTGQILRAWDASGTRQGEDVVAKLQSSGYKPGTHAFGFTGGSMTIPAGQPDAGQEYRQRTNAITGQIENIITTGPNRSKVYEGPPGLEKRVETNAAVKLNDAYIDFQTKPTIAMATEMLKLAGKVDDGKNNAINNTMAEIQRRSPDIFNKVMPIAGDLTGRPLETTTVTTEPSGKVNVGGKTTGGAGVGGAGGSLLQKEKGQEAQIQIGKELTVAEKKPPAEAKGKIEAKDINNQNFANETYGLIKPVAELVKKSTGSGIGAKVDVLASQFGKGTEGAQAIAQLEPLVYPILANVPRFEGPQSDYDVKTYMKAAGDFANPEKPVATRLAALQGMITLLKKYDKEGKNDWTFGAAETTTVKPYDDVEKERRYQEYLKKRNAGR